MIGFRGFTVHAAHTRRVVTRVTYQKPQINELDSGELLSMPQVKQEFIEEKFHWEKALLGSIAHSTVWHKNSIEAECPKIRGRDKKTSYWSHELKDFVLIDHIAPEKDCTCGIYAYYDFNYGKDELDGEALLAVVQAWGKIQLHETGFRAQYMSIIGLVDSHYDRFVNWMTEKRDSTALQALAKRYNVPVVTEQYARHLQNEFKDDWKRIFDANS